MAGYAAALLCCAILALAAASSAEPRAAPGAGTLTARTLIASQPDEIRERLLEEKLVLMRELRPTRSRGLIVGLVIFDQPVDHAYAFLAQTERQIEVRPEVVEIRAVSRGEHHIDEHHLKILFTRYAYRLQYTLGPSTHRLAWDLDPDFDNDLKQVSGFWELYAMDERRTLARFGTRVDVGPAVPGFLQDWITREKVPDTMERTRRWVNAEGRL